jgi:cysteinyl-tRNA synthetase
MKVFNNLTRQLEDFVPINGRDVYFYSCGPTVYDVSHIGHARSTITWDVLYRYLLHKGYQVKWIRNITNIDDKIVNRAKERDISPDKLARIYTYEFWHDMVALNVSFPEYEPRATDYMSEMFEFIQGLIDKGSAYESNGDVYFRVNTHAHYGQLKGQTLEQLREGEARVDANTKKEDRLDFALWKAFPDSPETSFKSPWSIGRPGWHLECSTMIKSILDANNAGDTLDIHAGGDDLVHPHHENECAQSECFTGKPLAKYWMHNGMVMVNGSKMSKSEGNFFTIKDLLAEFKANTIRYFCLSTHYKKQINFSREALAAAETGFDKLYSAVNGQRSTVNGIAAIDRSPFTLDHLNPTLIKKFNEAMNNDMNTAQALAAIFEHKDSVETVGYLLGILGFDLVGHEFTKNSHDTKSAQALSSVMDLLLDLRAQARVNKDFTTGDKIRDGLSAAGLTVKDHRDKPSEWSL